MTDSKSDNYLHFSDLKLLMDNYQNVVKLNTILLEQQKQIIELQKEILKNQNNILCEQTDICKKLNNVVTKMDICASHFKDIEDDYKSLDAALHSRFNDSTLKSDVIKESIDNINLDMVKQHSGISLKIYAAWGGSIAIILTLITLLTTSYSKLESIIEMLQKLT